MLARLQELAEARRDFAFETTLAGRSHSRWIRKLLTDGYEFHVVFIWLPSVEFAVQRVRDRVRLGGHGVPEETIRRRYHAGLKNFFQTYRPLATSWRVYDNSAGSTPDLIATGAGSTTEISDAAKWSRIENEGRR